MLTPGDFSITGTARLDQSRGPGVPPPSTEALWMMSWNLKCPCDYVPVTMSLRLMILQPPLRQYVGLHPQVLEFIRLKPSLLQIQIFLFGIWIFLTRHEYLMLVKVLFIRCPGGSQAGSMIPNLRRPPWDVYYKSKPCLRWVWKSQTLFRVVELSFQNAVWVGRC